MPSSSFSPPGSRRTPRPRRAGAAVAVLGSLALALAPSVVSAAPQQHPTGPAPTASPGGVDLPLDGAPTSPSQLRDEPRQVFVQLAGEGAADAAQHARGRSAKVRAAQAARHAARNKGQQVLSRAKGLDAQAQELWSVGNAVPGIAISADSDALRAVAQMDQVVKVSALIPKRPVNSNGAELTNVLKTWQDTGTYGDGVTIGIIDTGTDYTHADLGGQGTTQAWHDARAAAASADWRDSLTALAAAKVVGGYDLSGDDYNADPQAPDYQPTPHPDENPIDCYGHGSHVAGIAAGYGEDADGSTFTGTYGDLTSSDLGSMRMSPGMAPAAQIYSLKVFGCTGSTDLVIPALDRALDPDGDGDLGDHLDIVNLSLGSDYATVDDPENDVVDSLAEHGVLPVIAMGNAGDLTDVGGSPGNAVRSLAVASSVDDFQMLDGLRVDAPADVAGIVPGQNSVAYDWATEPPVTGDVVALSGANSDGCGPLGPADAAAVAGKVAWLTWDSDDGTRRCGSAGRSANVKAAGAIGAVFTGDVSPFTAGITGDADIPVFQLTKASTETLQPAVEAGTLVVTFDGALALTVSDVDPSITDLVSSFSSRGTHGSIGVVKPDVAAPGDSIVSIGVGSGDGALSESGTSMATPHAAGIAALVKETHPGWTVEQLKADLMNTAAHDVWSEPNQSGHAYGPARVGAGRVDAAAAVGNTVVAYSTDVPGGVSASFGVVAVPITQATATRTRTVTVANTGGSPATVTPSYDAAVEQPGVSYSVSPGTLTVGAGQTGRVVVTMSITTAELRHSIDPTMAPEQSSVPRQYVSDASGRLVLTTAAGQHLRVPVYGAVKPTSQTSASVVTTGHGKKATSRIDYSGHGFTLGSGSESFTSLTSVSTLGATSPQLPACGGSTTTGCTVNQTAVAGDLQYVGAGSSPTPTGYADGWLWFSIATYGDWATVGNSTIPYVDLDTTGDGQADYEVYVQNLTGTDVLAAWLVDLASGQTIDAEPVNFTFEESNVFDTNVLTIPVWPAMVGVTDTARSYPITYQVGTFSYYTNNPTGDIDTAGPVSYDVVRPNIAPPEPLYYDQAGTSVELGHVGLNKSGAPHCKGHCPDKRFKTLVLHLHGATGERAEVLYLP
ncbi:S8 family peptidase [Ornithinimicrobium avium]|uniref:Peptidase S8 n=1 Tax=Ornithinimicrobium avium TaxID=2283195 RepID=A0A345NJN8_9MICO|nr:S8 family serine peptidase [Ornithinimicrobium avium]AXH95246.1 peptidase S8 [Ornithinimicrobium avium]